MEITDIQTSLHIDCAKCCGLCCRALYFSKLDGFPEDKLAGVRCMHLTEDYRCQVHDQLAKQGLKGCMNFDCLGAGQWLTHLFQEDLQASQERMLFSLFPDVMQIHQTIWYLLELYHFALTEEDKQQIMKWICSVKQISSIKELVAFDVKAFQSEANQLIKAVVFQSIPINDNHHQYMGHNFKGRQLNNYDMHMKVAIGADFRGCSLVNTIFLGTDVRDANFSGCDLRKARFLTQAQVNSMLGDALTILPDHLFRPSTWLL